MKNLILFFFIIIAVSCGRTSRLFSKKTPHEQYAEKIDDAGLENTPEGRQWLSASKTALENPLSISLPYKHQGYFHSDKPRALGLQFKAKEGQRIIFTLNKKTSAPITLYGDLYKSTGTATSLLLSADTAVQEFSIDVEGADSYTLRLQPPLYDEGEYSLSISIAPSLQFPVSGTRAKTGSFWGDDRDGGKRSHEGIDIFAPKLTPAVAAADGYITGVKEGGIGGKTVWLRPAGKNYTLYYAHLDKQTVSEGQLVKKGDVIGLVGNTGNAKNTPSHLHFGIYTWTGPIDPLPFVNPAVKTASAPPQKKLSAYLKTIKEYKAGTVSVAKNTMAVPLAVTEKGYLAELPGGSIVQLPFTLVKTIEGVTNGAIARIAP